MEIMILCHFYQLRIIFLSSKFTSFIDNRNVPLGSMTVSFSRSTVNSYSYKTIAKHITL